MIAFTNSSLCTMISPMEALKKELKLDPAHLMSKLRQKDKAVMSKLIEMHSPVLFRASFALGFSKEQSLDLIQDVWLTFFDVSHHFEGRSSIRTFLFGILHNKAHEARRETKKENQFDPIDEIMENKFDETGHWITPPENPEKMFARGELRQQLNECFKLLPQIQKQIFLATEMESLDSEMICKTFSLSSGNVRVLLFRARNRLRECLEKKFKSQAGNL